MKIKIRQLITGITRKRGEQEALMLTQYWSGKWQIWPHGQRKNFLMKRGQLALGWRNRTQLCTPLELTNCYRHLVGNGPGVQGIVRGGDQLRLGEPEQSRTIASQSGMTFLCGFKVSNDNEPRIPKIWDDCKTGWNDPKLTINSGSDFRQAYITIGY